MLILFLISDTISIVYLVFFLHKFSSQYQLKCGTVLMALIKGLASRHQLQRQTEQKCCLTNSHVRSTCGISILPSFGPVSQCVINGCSPGISLEPTAGGRQTEAFDLCASQTSARSLENIIKQQSSYTLLCSACSAVLYVHIINHYIF